MYDVSIKECQRFIRLYHVAWANAFDGMKVTTLDGETVMRSKGAGDWAMYNQITLKHKAPHEKAWLVERNNA